MDGSQGRRDRWQSPACRGERVGSGGPRRRRNLFTSPRIGACKLPPLSPDSARTAPIRRHRAERHSVSGSGDHSTWPASVDCHACRPRGLFHIRFFRGAGHDVCGFYRDRACHLAVQSEWVAVDAGLAFCRGLCPAPITFNSPTVRGARSPAMMHFGLYPHERVTRRFLTSVFQIRHLP